MSKNPKNSKRPRLQTTRASDIAQNTHQFTHSSNTLTRTRQIVTSAEFVPSEPINSSPGMDMQSDELDLYPVPDEVEHPAGIEVLTRAPRYVNSVWMTWMWSSRSNIKINFHRTRPCSPG
jgi:hypothetical protein